MGIYPIKVIICELFIYFYWYKKDIIIDVNKKNNIKYHNIN